MARLLLTSRPVSATRSIPRLKQRSGSQRAAPAIPAPARVHTALRAVGEVRAPSHGETTQQITLPVGPASHRYEREAQRIADRAMRMRDRKVEGSTALGGPFAARFGLPNHSPVQQWRCAGASAHSAALERPILGHTAGGRPMSETTRIQMESCFGADFRGVHIHTDSRAAHVSRALNAQALTLDNDIFFDTGKYDPGSAAGGRLLAHELSHVVQQQRGDVAPNVVQRALADVQAPAPARPVAEPPVDCTTAITQSYTCWDLIAEMSRLRFDIAENDGYIERYDKGELPWDTDAYVARVRQKAELQKKFKDKERIRAECCPSFEVPPLAPTAPPKPEAPPVAPTTSPPPKIP
jgi:Domain of unknown function (DUF4157)